MVVYSKILLQVTASRVPRFSQAALPRLGESRVFRAFWGPEDGDPQPFSLLSSLMPPPLFSPLLSGLLVLRYFDVTCVCVCVCVCAQPLQQSPCSIAPAA